MKCLSGIKFKNISCLRLSNMINFKIHILMAFKNISCLRLRLVPGEDLEGQELFKNISCLRLSSVFSNFIKL